MSRTITKIGPAEHGRRMSLAEAVFKAAGLA
jgi:hypothetical protein